MQCNTFPALSCISNPIMTGLSLYSGDHWLSCGPERENTQPQISPVNGHVAEIVGF